MLNPSITIYIKKTVVTVEGGKMLKTCKKYRFKRYLSCLLFCLVFSANYTLINNLKLYLDMNNLLSFFERSYLGIINNC